MAHCRDCGEEVSWHKRPDGSTHPPIEYIGSVLVVINNTVQDAPSYQRHRCDPANVETWQAHAEEQLRLEVARQEELDLQWSLALKYACPKCGVAKKKRCENLIKRAKGENRLIIWPHPDRLQLNPKWVPLAERENNEEAQAEPKSPAHPKNGKAPKA